MTEDTSRGASSPRPIALGAWRGPAARTLAVDLLAVVLAVALPWSMSGVAIFMVLWSLTLAVVGALWADSPWPARLRGISPGAKLLAVPFLLYHFEPSQRATCVFAGFPNSCALLMGLWWIVLFAPEFKAASTANPGVPVENYIDQGQEFLPCLFALAAAYTALMLGFLANIMFVVSALTALVCIPVLLGLFAVLYLCWRATALLFAGAVAAAALWITSPYFRDRVEVVAIEYQSYQESNAASSTGLRLEYWRKSLRFFANAPMFGDGTGSSKELFECEAIGQSGASADVTGNPHNQTLNVAVQWGLFRLRHALCDVVLSPPAIPPDEPFLVDRPACGCPECRELAVEFVTVRFS